MALMHLWPFESASTTSADSIGERDLTSASAVSTATGLIGNALQAENTYGLLSSGTERALDCDGANAFSIAVAVQFDNASGSQEVIAYYTQSTQVVMNLYRRPSGAISFLVRNTNSTEYTLTSTTLTSDSTWYHIVGTFTRNGTMRLWIDAVDEDNTATSDHRWETGATSPRFVVSSRQGQLDRMTGRIDQLSIYDHQLDSDEVSALYNSGSITDQAATYEADYTTNLVHYWKLEESSGNRLATVGGSAFSITSDAGNATGILGDGLQFDGSAIADNNTLLSINNADEVTISFWVNFANALTVREAIIRHADSAGGNLTYIADRRETTGFLDTRFWGADGANDQNQSNFALLTSTWYHVACTYRRNGVQRQYINGSSLTAGERFTDDQGIRDLTGDSSFRMGANQAGTLPLLNAVVDELAIYNRALSTGDIVGYYNSGSPPDLTPVSTGGGRASRSHGGLWIRHSS